MRIKFLSFALLVFILTGIFPDSRKFPVISSLDRSDLLFRQITEDIKEYYKRSEQDKELLPLVIYSYITEKNTTIFALAARFNLPYETIVTLNHISTSEDLNPGTRILIPNIPGIFVPGKPVSDLELMISSWRNIDDAVKIITGVTEESTFYFYPGEKFHRVERAFFLGTMFRFPLPKGIISSGYGNRIHPIVGGTHFHNGIDIAAPEDTEVMAARGGEVTETGYDETCGNYIIIQHENGYDTVYCHLKKIFVELNQQVQSGMIIAVVGSTGMSTGPHLHFEIRKHGESKDPSLLLPGKN